MPSPQGDAAFQHHRGAQIPCYIFDVVAGVGFEGSSAMLEYRRGQRVYFLDDGYPLRDAEPLRKAAASTDQLATVYLYNLEEVATQAASPGAYTLDEAIATGRVPDDEMCQDARADPEYHGKLCSRMTTEMREQYRGLNIAEAHWDKHVRRQADRLRSALAELSSAYYEVFEKRELVDQLFRDCVVPEQLISELPERATGASTLWDVLCSTFSEAALDFKDFDRISAERADLLVVVKDLLAALGEQGAAATRRPRLDDIVPNRNDVDQCRKSKVILYGEVVDRLHLLKQQQASPLEGQAQKALERAAQLSRRARGRADEARVPRAFVAALYEINRQRNFNREFRRAAETFKDRLEAARQREILRRSEYDRQHAKHLPKWPIFLELTSKPCRVSKVEPPHGLELPDLRAAADVALRSVAEHMREARIWDPPAGALVDGQIQVEAADIPTFTDEQASKHAETLANLLVGANAELGELSAERDGLAGRLEEARDAFESSKEAMRFAAQARAEADDRERAQLAERIKQLEASREDDHRAARRAEDEARAAAAELEQSASMTKELQATLAASRAEVATLTAELEKLKARPSQADHAAQTEPANAARSSSLSDSGSSSADPPATEGRGFICFRGFRVGDLVLFRRRERGGKSVYAALIAGARDIYLDMRQAVVLLQRGFEEVMGEVTTVDETSADPTEYGLEPGKKIRIISVNSLMGFERRKAAPT